MKLEPSAHLRSFWFPRLSSAQAITLDTSELRPGAVTCRRRPTTPSRSRGPTRRRATWRATFSLDPARPLDYVDRCRWRRRSSATRGRSIEARPASGAADGTRSSTIRRAIPKARGTCRARSRCAARKRAPIGDRVELVFDGMRMGGFEGALAYTFYPGSRLIQQEAVLTTNDPDVAYYYDAGLDMAAPADRTAGNNMRSEIAYYDTSGTLKRRCTAPASRPSASRCRSATARLRRRPPGGSVAVFPAPHQYFFPRDFSSNLAYLWHRWMARPRRASASGSCATRTGSTTRG